MNNYLARGQQFRRYKITLEVSFFVFEEPQKKTLRFFTFFEFICTLYPKGFIFENEKC